MKFSYNPRILEQLGTELITSDEVAFTELLKNAYDAKAQNVRVHFLNSIDHLQTESLLTPLKGDIKKRIKVVVGNDRLIIIEDDGIGMNETQLRDGFFTVGSDLKEKLQKAELSAGVKEKMTLGDKGLGRLASQRLASTMMVETTSADEKDIHFVEVEWKRFFESLKAEAPEHSFSKNGRRSYTRLWFTGGVDFQKFIDDRREKQMKLFEDDDIQEGNGLFLQERLQSSISFLKSPFESSGIDFSIKFYWNENEVASTFHSESINIAETIHEFSLGVQDDAEPHFEASLKIQPWFVEMIHLRLLGKELFEQNQRPIEFYATLLETHKERLSISLSRKTTLKGYLKDHKKNEEINAKELEKICPIEGKVFSFHRDNYRLKIAMDAAKQLGKINKADSRASVRDFLNYHNGIKLYRDKFRIANLGDKESDWLNLQQARTKGQQFFRFELGNVVGYVKVSDFYQQYIREISSRQELKQNGHSNALRAFLQVVFNNTFHQLSTTAYYLVRDILYEENLIPENSPEELKKKVSRSEELLKETLGNLDKFKKGVEQIKSHIKSNAPDKINKIEEVVTSLDEQEKGLSESINSSINSLKSAKDTLVLIEEKRKESYNNYKLMANGLITEVMTHELHSILLNTKKGVDYGPHVEALKNYIFDKNEPLVYSQHLKPLDERLSFLHTRINELDVFYNFLEKTFIKEGTVDDFESESLNSLMESFKNRLGQRLKKNKIDFRYETLEPLNWFVPKGSLTHVFYNLLDNSIHWILERQKRAAYDKKYRSELPDFIEVKKISEKVIHVSDSGTGIIPEIQYTLFHPFKSGRPDGRGMGLYIVKNLLESFGGSIELLPDLNNYGNRYIFEVSVQQEEAQFDEDAKG